MSPCPQQPDSMVMTSRSHHPSCLHKRLMARVTFTTVKPASCPINNQQLKHFNEQHCPQPWETSTEALSVVNAKGFCLGQKLLSDEEEVSMFNSAADSPKRQTFNHAPTRGVFEHPRVVVQLSSLCWFDKTDKSESRRDVTCSVCVV